MKYKLIKDASRKELPWLINAIKKGTIVYSFSGCTYGCCNYSAYTFDPNGEGQFFELPTGFVEKVPG